MSKRVDSWSHIILEGFCLRHTTCHKDKYVYEVISWEPYKTKKKKNKCYDSTYKTPKKPKYCKSKICKDCWDNDCIHLGLSTPDDEEYIEIMKKINEMYEDE